MDNKVRFLADEHIALSAIRNLVMKGVNIVSVNEVNLRKARDEEIMEFANKESRAIVTRDKDFLRLASQGEKHKGIIFLTKPLATGEIIRDLEKISVVYKTQDIENSVLYIPVKH